MKKDIENIITGIIRRKKRGTASEVVKKTGLSRAYVNRFFRDLRDQGKIVLIGKANRAHYITADERVIMASKRKILSVTRIIQNTNISEDAVISRIKRDSGIFEDIPQNVAELTGYALSEMLNNAIEHSRSRQIRIDMQKDHGHIVFNVTDKGMGIFNNIREKKGLTSNMDAIQDLLKGKETTAPQSHSGEGIFFTSKVADVLTIQSSEKKLVFNNLIEDIFIRNARETRGTRVNFSVSTHTKKRLEDIFRQYTDSSYEFSKTDVIVKLYNLGSECISRSQARRIVAGLEKFKTVMLDFKGVNTVGQAFADEVFRVWKSDHPDVVTIVKNANENVEFMIKRAQANAI